MICRALAGTLALLTAATLAAQEAHPPSAVPRLVWDGHAVVARDLPGEAGAAHLALYTVPRPGGAASALPVAGRTEVGAGGVRFTPQYPLVPGLQYEARARLAGRPDLIRRFALGVPATPPTRVTQLFPSADQLPENVLRFYLHFSGPMRRGEADARVHLLGPDGRVVPGAFLRVGQELWNPAMTRLTLVVDPGRLKRGVAPNRQAGPPLRAGGTYRLVVDAGWPDAAGQLLRQGAQKTFVTTAADRTSPRLDAWSMSAPRAGSREPLLVTFGEVLDQALLSDSLRVETAAGRPVPGHAAAVDGERGWRFTPDAAWGQGGYQLAVSAALEDVAGNNLREPFEVEARRARLPGAAGDVIHRPIRLRSGPPPAAEDTNLR